MINLLAPQEKAAISLWGNQALAIVLGVMALVGVLGLVLVVYAVQFSVWAELSRQQVSTKEFMATYQTPDFLHFKDLVKDYNARMVSIETFLAKKTSLADALHMFDAISRPEGIHVSRLALERVGETGNYKVSVAGVSETREQLQSFKEAIEKNQAVGSFYFPPNNWIKSSNLDFYLTFEITSP